MKRESYIYRFRNLPIHKLFKKLEFENLNCEQTLIQYYENLIYNICGGV
jgi:hypothetical protein